MNSNPLIRIALGCSTLLFSILATSCSGSEEPFLPDNEHIAIVPTSNLIPAHNEDGTRAGGVIDPGAAINVSLFRANVTYPTAWTGVSSLPASINTAGTVTFTTAQYYPTNGNATKLVGVYPAEGTGAVWSATNGTMTYTIDGYTDIMATSIVEASKSTAQPALTFNHLLTQIEFSLIGEDATAIGLWGTVSSISITGRNNSCVVTLPKPNATGAATATYSGSATLTARKKNGTATSATTVTTTDATFGYCLMAPIVSTALSLSVVTSVGGTVTVTVPAKVYEVGTAYKIQLKLTKKAIVPEATITNWTSGGATTTVTL